MREPIKVFLVLGICYLLNTPVFANLNFETAKARTISKSEMITAPCKKRSKYCKGEATFKDGSTYKGEFRYGDPHGNGVYTWPDGETYEGNFMSGLRHGKGRHVYNNKDVYDGEWEFGMMHGKGTYSWNRGDKYTGGFVEGLMQGKGKIILDNGEVYEGEWKNGLADGKGTYTRIDGSKYMGKSKKGERHGSGRIVWKTGDYFIGKWKKGRINKTGTFHYNNGDQYISIWDNGEMSGEATYIFEDGKEIKGNLKDVENGVFNDEERMEEIMPNLGLTWYAIAIEYKNAEKYDMAMENLKMAQKYVPASSDLNQLIHHQKEIVQKKLELLSQEMMTKIFMNFEVLVCVTCGILYIGKMPKNISSPKTFEPIIIY